MKVESTLPLVRVMQREFRRIAERKTLSMLSIGLPSALFVLLAWTYANAIVRDLPVAVCDDDRSELSRMIVRSFDASASMNVAMHVRSMDDIREAMAAGRVQAGIVIPRGFEADVKRGASSTVTVVKNSFNLIIGNMILKDASSILKTMSGGAMLKKLRANGMGAEQAMNVVSPIRLDTQVLYNSNYSYLDYLIPPLLAVMLQMIIMVSGALVISSEFTHGTYGELLEAGNGSLAAVYFGKALPHLAIHAATVLGMVGILFPMFGIAVRGSVIAVLFVLLYFAAASLSLALAVSSLFPDQQKATEAAVFLVTPAFIFSGLTFPAWAMPALPRWYAQTMPFTPFLNAFLKLSQMDTPFVYCIPEMIHLSVFLFGSAAVALIALRMRTRVHAAVSAARGETSA